VGQIKPKPALSGGFWRLRAATGPGPVVDATASSAPRLVADRDLSRRHPTQRELWL